MRWALSRAGTAFRSHWVVLVGLVAVSGLVVAVDPEKVAAALRGAEPLALVLMLPAVLALYVLRGVAWWFALRGARTPVRLGEAIRVTWISQTFVFLPGGDLWRVPIVRGDGSIPVQRGGVVGAVVFDDLVYFYVLSAAMVPGVLANPRLAILLAGALLPQTAIFAVLLWPALYDRLAGPVARLPGVRRFAPQLELLGPAFRRLFTRKTLIPVLITDAACALLAISLFGLSLRAVHAHPEIRQIAFTFSIANVASGLTVLPGALGAYEGMMTGLMAIQGVPPPVAAAAALLYRGFNDVLMALLGLGLAFVAAPRPRWPRWLTEVPWAVLRMGHAGGGRASGIPWVWSAWEALWLRRHPLVPVQPGALLRYRLVVHRGGEIRLQDGSTVHPGDLLIELHMDNRRLASLREEPGYSAWGMVHRIRNDLDVLATRLAAGELGVVVAIRGVSLLSAAGGLLGFEVRPLPRGPGAAFQRYFMLGLDAIYHPQGLSRLRGRPRLRRPVEMWMSTATLVARSARKSAAGPRSRSAGPRPATRR